MTGWIPWVAAATFATGPQLPKPVDTGPPRLTPPKVEPAKPEAAKPLPPTTEIRSDAEPRQTIDLATALRLAGVQNPRLLIANNRVDVAFATQRLAAARFLPDLNAGMNYNAHNGNLQASSGEIVDVNRNSLYAGFGAGAVGAGTVGVPGVALSMNPVDVTFEFWRARQQTVRFRRLADAEALSVMRGVANAYVDLLQAEARVAVIRQNLADNGVLAKITADYAKVGQGRQSDASRAAAVVARTRSDLAVAEGDLARSSARLAALLNLDAATPLRTADKQAIPIALMPLSAKLPELLAQAATQRPEVAASRAAIREAILRLDRAKLLPFSPQVVVGFSVGTFGGGSDLAAGSTAAQPQSRFGQFMSRNDFDAIAYWTLENLGAGNVLRVRRERTLVRNAELGQVVELNRIAADVADAFARWQARGRQLEEAATAISTSSQAVESDLRRIRAHEGIPLEVADSLRLLSTSRLELLDAVSDFNRAQIDLRCAVGDPPPDALPVVQPPPPPARGGAK